MNCMYQSGIFPHFYSERCSLLQLLRCPGAGFARGFVARLVHPRRVQAGRLQARLTAGCPAGNELPRQPLTPTPGEHLLFCSPPACSPGSRHPPGWVGWPWKQRLHEGLRTTGSGLKPVVPGASGHDRLGCEGTLCASQQKAAPRLMSWRGPTAFSQPDRGCRGEHRAPAQISLP